MCFFISKVQAESYIDSINANTCFDKVEKKINIIVFDDGPVFPNEKVFDDRVYYFRKNNNEVITARDPSAPKCGSSPPYGIHATGIASVLSGNCIEVAEDFSWYKFWKYCELLNSKLPICGIAKKSRFISIPNVATYSHEVANQIKDILSNSWVDTITYIKKGETKKFFESDDVNTLINASIMVPYDSTKDFRPYDNVQLPDGRIVMIKNIQDLFNVQYNIIEQLLETISARRGSPADRFERLILIVPAGNNGKLLQKEDIDKFPFPQSLYKYNKVIVVGATYNNKSPKFADKNSNYSPNIVSIAAPGVNIPVLNVNCYAHNVSGTSISVPMVTAAIACIWTCNPSMYADDVIKILFQQSTKLDSLKGYVKESRYLNVCAAVNAVCDVEPHIPKKKSEKKLDDASDIILSTPIKHERNDTKKSLKDEL